MPPEPSMEPALEAYMAAAACISGSWAACSFMTLCRILKNSGFSLRVSGVGGEVVEVPIARKGMGGDFERKDSRYERGFASSCSWMYCGDIWLGRCYVCLGSPGSSYDVLVGW